MKRVGIVGGDTHIGEITALAGDRVRVVGAVVREDQAQSSAEQFGCAIFAECAALYDEVRPDIVAIANENDCKAAAVVEALEHGCDVVVDKPLAITLAGQTRIEACLKAADSRRLLMLLTLRGSPCWAGLRRVVLDGRIGVPAFTHVRMAVRLKRAQRPPWFLDSRRSGGLFLDLLIHGLDQVEWLTGRRIVAMSANMGNLGDLGDRYLLDHAAVYCELDDGSSALVEGQRMLPDTKASDYRVTVAGTEGFADLDAARNQVLVTTPEAAESELSPLPEATSVVEDWLDGGTLVGQEASLRANRLALAATRASETHERLQIGEP